MNKFSISPSHNPCDSSRIDQIPPCLHLHVHGFAQPSIRLRMDPGSFACLPAGPLPGRESPIVGQTIVSRLAGPRRSFSARRAHRPVDLTSPSHGRSAAPMICCTATIAFDGLVASQRPAGLDLQR